METKMTFYNTNIISELIKDGLKIHAIKEIREQTGCSLKEAKYYIDQYPMRDMDDCERSSIMFEQNHIVDFLTEEDFII